MSDSINPDHYKRLPAEAIEIIESAIDNAPSNQDAYLQGQVLKYVLRCWNKNGIEDLKKAKWYLDRLIEHCDLRESLLDISKGLVKAWTCEDGKAKQVYPEQPVVKESLITKPDPGEGYRLLGKDPPEKLLDTDEGLFACGLDGQQWLSVNYSSGEQLPSVYYRRKIDVETLKQSPQPPDGWRWLEVGEVFRKGDTTNTIEPISEHWVGTQCVVKHVALRRNRFEVGEKVVRVYNGVVYKVIRILSMGYQLESEFCVEVILYGKDLAPYIEETK